MAQGDDLEMLLSRVALRDRAAFARLYQLTSLKLFGICLRILKSRSAAEDVMQEVYVKVWRNAQSYSSARARPITWLAAIARNQSIDRLRAARRADSPLEEADLVADDTPSPEQAAVAGSERARLEACLDELDARHAGAVRNAYLEGWSYQEIADRLDVPLNTVKTWIRRSLIKLKDCLSRS